MKEQAKEIVKFTGRYDITIKDLIDNKSISSETANNLIQSINSNKNVVIFGGGGAGKTCLIEALLRESSIIRDRKIYISEYPEIKPLNHQFVDADLKSYGGSKLPLADTIITVLKMNPDYLYVDEMRDRNSVRNCEMTYLTGHGVVVTTHSNSKEMAASRLTHMAELTEGERGLTFLENAIFVHITRSDDGSRQIEIV